MTVTRVLAICAVLFAGPAIAQTKQGNQPPGPARPNQPQQQQQQQPQQPPEPAPAKPYKPLAMSPPAPLNDAGLDELRKQIATAAQKKDRAALTRLVVGKNFFWERETGDRADKKKSGVDNLVTALGLANKDGVGWDMLQGYAEETTASPIPGRTGLLCAPADPTFDLKAFEALLKATDTDFSEWGYPLANNVDVHAAAQANAPVIGRLGAHLVRVMPEDKPVSPTQIRIVMPDGKTGYVSTDAIAPIGGDRLCYVKEGGAWKIGGYMGGGDAQ